MKKSEVKDGIKSIQLSFFDFKEHFEEELQPYEEANKHLEALQGIEENDGVEIGIEYDDVRITIIRNILENSSRCSDVIEQIDLLMSDLENWKDDSGEKKAEQIQEQYIEPLEELRELWRFDEVEDIDGVKNIMEDMESSLENFFDR